MRLERSVQLSATAIAHTTAFFRNDCDHVISPWRRSSLCQSPQGIADIFKIATTICSPWRSCLGVCGAVPPAWHLDRAAMVEVMFGTIMSETTWAIAGSSAAAPSVRALYQTPQVRVQGRDMSRQRADGRSPPMQMRDGPSQRHRRMARGAGARGGRAPADVACAHSAGAPARGVRIPQVPKPHPLVGPLAGWPCNPTADRTTDRRERAGRTVRDTAGQTKIDPLATELRGRGPSGLRHRCQLW